MGAARDAVFIDACTGHEYAADDIGVVAACGGGEAVIA
jgi:hypothetical protein